MTVRRNSACGSFKKGTELIFVCCTPTDESPSVAAMQCLVYVRARQWTITLPILEDGGGVIDAELKRIRNNNSYVPDVEIHQTNKVDLHTIQARYAALLHIHKTYRGGRSSNIATPQMVRASEIVSADVNDLGNSVVNNLAEVLIRVPDRVLFDISSLTAALSLQVMEHRIATLSMEYDSMVRVAEDWDIGGRNARDLRAMMSSVSLELDKLTSMKGLRMRKTRELLGNDSEDLAVVPRRSRRPSRTLPNPLIRSAEASSSREDSHDDGDEYERISIEPEANGEAEAQRTVYLRATSRATEAPPIQPPQPPTLATRNEPVVQEIVAASAPEERPRVFTVTSNTREDQLTTWAIGTSSATSTQLSNTYW